MRRIRRHQGVAFILAILALMLMLMIGTMFLRVTAHQYQNANRQAKAAHALAMAEAGVQYMIWRQKWAEGDTGGEVRTVSANSSLPTDYDPRQLDPATSGYDTLNLSFNDEETENFTAWLFRSPAGSSEFQLVVQGDYRDYDRKVRVLLNDFSNVVQNDPIFDWALYGRTKFETSGLIVDGKAGTNGSFKGSNNIHITGGFNAAGSFSISGENVSIGGLTEYGTTVSFPKAASITPSKTGKIYSLPDFSMADWQARAQAAGGYIGSGVSFSGGTHSFASQVVYINGNFSCSGETVINGPVTIVVNGSISLSGSVRVLPNSSGETGFGLISNKSVALSGGSYVEGFIYCHNSLSTGLFSASGSSTVVGGIVVDQVKTSGTVTVKYRKPTIDLPGEKTGDVSWVTASWQQL